jgi:hypothetical protein
MTFKAEQIHTFAIKPMVDAITGEFIRLDRATLEIGTNDGGTRWQAKLTSRSGDSIHLDLDALRNLQLLLSDMAKQGKL